MSRRGLLAAIACLVIVSASAYRASSVEAETEALFDPVTGYRIAHFRAPVSIAIPGATKTDYDGIIDLVRNRNAVLLDVMVGEGAGPDPQTGAWRLTRSRRHIPGSVWLPNVGKGTLDAALESYYRQNLVQLTCGDKSRPVIIYCVADCWMGWNAAKRALSYGYKAVYWYPEGSDGWSDWDGRLTDATAVPIGHTAEASCDQTRPPPF